jgi:hypothetical protein
VGQLKKSEGWLKKELKSALWRSWGSQQVRTAAKTLIDERQAFHLAEGKLARGDALAMAWYDAAIAYPSKSVEVMQMIDLAYREWMSLPPPEPEPEPEPEPAPLPEPEPEPPSKPEPKKEPARKPGQKLGTGSIKMGLGHDPTDPSCMTLEYSAKDVAWVYHNLTNPKAKEKTAPSNGSWGLLQYSRSYPADFYKSILPAAMKKAISEEGDAAEVPNADEMAAFEKALVEVNQLVEQQAAGAS